MLRDWLEQLDRATHAFDYAGVRALLREAVAEYQPDAGIEDWVWQAVQPGTPGCAQQAASVNPATRDLARSPQS